MTSRRIVSDVGGSNARFARCPAPGVLTDLKSYRVSEFPSFYDTLDAYLIDTGGVQGADTLIIGVAGPIDGNRVQLTNSPWFIETQKAAALLGPDASARLVNDLEAVALALPYLTDDDLQPLGPANRNPATARSMVAVNVGTGFGGAAAIRTGQGWAANPGEPGHMVLGALNEEELALFGPARTIEDYLSGRGVPSFYARICDHLGQTCDKSLDCAAILARANTDPAADKLVGMITEILGRVAGDFVLASAAWGGAYLCGSVVNGWMAATGGKDFRDHFEAKGAMTDRMRTVYSGIITRTDTALLGLSHSA